MDENLNLSDNIRQLILVALNTSCCLECAAGKLGITRTTLVAKKKEYNIVRESRNGRYVVKIRSQSMRPLQSVA